MPVENQHSARVSALLGKPPGWLLRWGTFVVFAVVAALLAVSAFVRYPEVIAAPVIISGSNPPQTILAQVNGRFAQFLVADGVPVSAGQHVAVLANEAVLADVIQLDSSLNRFSTLWKLADTALPKQIWPNLQLGEVQGSYQAFQLAFLDLNQFFEQRAYAMQLAALNRQYVNYKMYYKRSWQQRMVLQEQYNLAAQRFYSDSLLAIDGVYDRHELSKRKEQLLQTQYALHGARAGLAQSQIQIAALEINIADLKMAEQRERENKRLALQNARDLLSQSIKKWQYNFVFTAEISGKLAYQTLWAVSQNVQAGQHVFTVVPSQKNSITAQMAVSPTRLAKINTGQRVQIKLDAYPFEEYGLLLGKVAKVNSTPIKTPDNDYVYMVSLQFEDSLQTTYGKPIAKMDELTGNAEIVTEELSLLERVFYAIRKLFR